MKNPKIMTANEALDGYIKSLPYKDRSKFQAKIVLALEISLATITGWRNSKSHIKDVYRREISNIAGKDIFVNVVD